MLKKTQALLTDEKQCLLVLWTICWKAPAHVIDYLQSGLKATNLHQDEALWCLGYTEGKPIIFAFCLWLYSVTFKLYFNHSLMMRLLKLRKPLRSCIYGITAGLMLLLLCSLSIHCWCKRCHMFERLEPHDTHRWGRGSRENIVLKTMGSTSWLGRY